MKPLKMLVLAATCTICATASAACFTVLNKDGQTIHQSASTPVDLSLPLHETVPARFGPGASMVFSMDSLASDCIPVGVKKDVEATRGDNVMSTVFANVRTWERPASDSAVPATTYPNPTPSAKTSQRY